MVDKVPKDITAGTANRGSTVHASDADIVGILSRGHLEEDISRIQAAVHLFDTGVTYKADDLSIESGNFNRANKATGPGAFVSADWDSVLGIRTLNAVNTAAQTLTGGVGIDITTSDPDHSFAIDSTVATLTGTQTLTNKTIDGDLNTILDINETQMNVSVGADGTVLTSNGVGLAPTYEAIGVQTRTNIVLTVDQAVTASGNTDITNFTITLPTVTGKFALILFNINYQSSQNDKDCMFRISDNAVIVEDIGQQLGQNDIGGLRMSYVAQMNGQVVKAVIDRDGGLDAAGTVTILGLTADGRESSMQVLELA